VRRSMELWVGCIAGALEEKEYERLLADAGFTDISVEPTRIYQFEDAPGRIMAAFIRARKPDLARRSPIVK